MFFFLNIFSLPFRWKKGEWLEARVQSEPYTIYYTRNYFHEMARDFSGQTTNRSAFIFLLFFFVRFLFLTYAPLICFLSFSCYFSGLAVDLSAYEFDFEKFELVCVCARALVCVIWLHFPFLCTWGIWNFFYGLADSRILVSPGTERENFNQNEMKNNEQTLPTAAISSSS